ncbi:16S rRNA (guanine(966)-N(2))-methyltransferase RsmD [Anaeromicropila herbilytica]|uniref:RNA methyltransferase n=1 Tax=Anaeromicropila herbilytica TaxID=2785025 RepID=A0A7R7EKJ5_9FIRM|nr:16S rRNA (guanine(966)-N(2))-methyltransferase RsmD [Anaeromicropila herbilytica]BCN30474.1 RNA methyltransferase [Anaeromicropila herbilytica]
MRVIAGKARRIPLKTIEGMDTRPTTDRIKETLFNMLNPYLADCQFLDLYSGSGAIGIEAISRGASHVVFVENNHLAIECIKSNLSATNLQEAAEIMNTDVINALKSLEAKGKQFDIIFMDPPYRHLHEKSVLEYLNQSNLVHEDTMIIVEASLDTDFSYLEKLNYQVMKRKEYKTNLHVFLEQA